MLACTAPDGEPAGAVRVTAVDVGRSRVEPIGWEPDGRRLRAPSSPTCRCRPAEVQLDPWVAPEPGDPRPAPTAADVAAVHDAVVAAIASAGPDGAPSPYVRVVEPGDGLGGCRCACASPSQRRASSRSRGPTAARSPARSPTSASREGAARLVVARLEHVARWEQVRSLGDHPSPLADAVTLDVYDGRREGETRRPPDRRPLPSRRRLPARVPAGARRVVAAAARVRRRCATASDDDLYVAVLDLTDRFRCHAVLPTTLLGAGPHVRPVVGRRRSRRRLPAGRPVAPGAAARDWLKVVVSDVDFDATSFDLAALDEPVDRAAASVRRRRRATPSSGSPPRAASRRRPRAGRRRPLGRPPSAGARVAAADDPITDRLGSPACPDDSGDQRQCSQ